MRPSATFLARFLALAGALFALWSFAGLGDLYSRAVLTVAGPFMWGLSGFTLSAVRPGTGGLDVFIRRGGREVLVPLQPLEVFSGLIPFLALAGASLLSPALWRSRGRFGGAARGLSEALAILFVFHVGLFCLGPFLATAHPRWVNRIIDVAYGFYGLVGFAALPFLLWFWLVHRRTAG